MLKWFLLGLFGSMFVVFFVAACYDIIVTTRETNDLITRMRERR